MTKLRRSMTICCLFLVVLLCGHFPGTDAPTRCRTACQDLWA